MTTLTDREFARLMAQKEFVLGTAEMLRRIMREENVTVQQLADRLGKPENYVSWLLDNLSLNDIAKICHLLGYKPKILMERDFTIPGFWIAMADDDGEYD